MQLQKGVDEERIRSEAARLQMLRKQKHIASAKVVDEVATGVCDQVIGLIKEYPHHEPVDLISEIKEIFQSSYMQRKLNNLLEFNGKKLTYFSKSQKKEVEREVFSISIIDVLTQLFKNKDVVDLLRKDHNCKYSNFVFNP